MFLDIALVLIIVFFAVRGYNRGLIKTLLGFFGVFSSGILAYFLAPTFKEMMIKFISVDKVIFDKVVKCMQDLGAAGAKQVVSGTDIDVLEKMMLPGSIKEKMTEFLLNKTGGITKSVALSISDFIMNILAYAVLFIAILVIVNTVGKLVMGAARLPVIKYFDKTGGLIFSLVSLYLIMTVGFLLFTSFASLNLSGIVADQISSSMVAKLFIEYNPIILILANA